MDRLRGGDRYNNSPDSHPPYRHSRNGPPRSSDDSPINNRRSPNNNYHRGGFSGGGGRVQQHRGGFDSPPRYPTGGGGGFGDSGFRPMGGRGGGPGGRGFNSSEYEVPLSGQKRFNPDYEVPLSGQKRFNPDYEVPLSGQKREFPFSRSPDHFDGGSFDKKNFDGGSIEKNFFDGGSFAKLFVGSVPRTATEEDIRPLFEEHGNVVEVALIKDKRTGQQQGCCFIKYATSEEADRAIRALHNQYTLPGGVGPIQVRYADGERERLGAVEYKLFVGSLNKQATEKEVEEIFSPYGRVEDVYLMRDEMKQSRGCGFVKFSNRDMAMAAINALNGIYTMRGCDQALIVRFADPKRPRPGESRGAPAFGGPGFGPWFQPPGFRPTPNLADPMRGPIPPNAWPPMNPPDMVPSSDVGMHGFGSQILPRSGDRTQSSTPAGTYGGLSASADGSLPGLAVPSSSVHQSFPPLAQLPSIGQKVSPLQKPNQSPQDFPSSQQLQHQTPASYSQAQPSGMSVRPLGQLQVANAAGQTSFGQGYPSQQMLGYSGQSPLPQPQVLPSVSSAATQTHVNNNFPPLLSAMANQQQLPGQQQVLQPLHQSPSPLAQMLSQQTQTLQASYQSSQQAFSQLQQQLQLMQPSNQSLTLQQIQAAKLQSPWAGSVPQTASTASAPTIKPGTDVLPATSASSVVPVTAPTVASTKCNWTEHTSPDGYKYYYNSTTGESKWEKPDELTSVEQQQQPQQQQQQQQQQQSASVQQPQTQSHPQGLSTQHVPQAPQLRLQSQLQTQLQTQIRHPQQLQHANQPSLYQAPGVTGHQNIQEFGYTQYPVGASSLNDPAPFQQGHQAAQEWIWKNKPAGT